MMDDSLTLAALLAHPNNGSLEVLTAALGVWKSVAAGVDERQLPDQTTPTLGILLTPTPANSWQIDALLRRTHDRGYTGLVLTGTPVGKGSCALASRLGMDLLQAANPIALARACWELLEARDALTLSAVRRVVQSIEYHAEDLADLLAHINATIGDGIALIDRQGALRSAGSPVPPELLARVSFDAWLDIVESTHQTLVSVPVDSGNRRDLRVALLGKSAGTAHRNALAAAVEVVMPMVAARLLIDEVEAVSDVSRSSGLLEDFLEERGSLDAEIERRMLARGWRTSGYHLGFRLIGRSRVDAFELLRLVRTELARLAVPEHATTRGAGVSGWLTFADAPSSTMLSQALRDLHTLHQRLQTHYPVATGVGSLTSGSAGLVTTLGEARDAATLAQQRPHTGWFLPINNLGLEQILLAWTASDTFTPAANTLLSPLREADLETLRVYLDEESSVKGTAHKLGLHRNTVSVRMQRIQEALGVDLHDPESRLAVQLALRAIR